MQFESALTAVSRPDPEVVSTTKSGGVGLPELAYRIFVTIDHCPRYGHHSGRVMEEMASAVQ